VATEADAGASPPGAESPVRRQALATGGASASTSGKGARGGGKGFKSGCEGMPRDVRISKTLTQILRHKAVDLGVQIFCDGYCDLEDVLKVPWLQSIGCTAEDVQKVVRDSDKKRFELAEEAGVIRIRAVQGHSIKVVQDEHLLRRLSAHDHDLPKQCVHGTYHRHLQSIMQRGLLAGGGAGQAFRNHIHFAPFDPGDRRVISGMRYDCEVAIWIDLKRALSDDVPFYMSANQVILSPGVNGCVDKKYFVQARDLKSNKKL